MIFNILDIWCTDAAGPWKQIDISAGALPKFLFLPRHAHIQFEFLYINSKTNRHTVKDPQAATMQFPLGINKIVCLWTWELEK